MIKRELENTILRLSKAFPVITILGPRQSGKTTLAKTIFSKHKYISFEEVREAREEAENDPRGFLHTHTNENGIILDEFHHVPNLLSYIQLLVDENRKPGFFVLTSSQNFLMNQAIAQSLAGRVAIVTLLPLSIAELKHAQLLPDYIEELAFNGTYPEKYVNPHLMIVDWYQNYVSTYLERDVRDIRKVGNLTTFQKFMRLCAARVGQILNVSGLADSCDIDVKTAQTWLSVLEASYVIFFQQPYSNKFTRRLVKSPKLYFYDPGIASFLLGLESVDELKLSTYRGNLIESLIMSEIAKIYYNKGRLPKMFFLQDKNDNEIDCILEKAQKLIPIEIKSRMTASRNLFDGFSHWYKEEEFQEKTQSNVYVIYTGKTTEKKPYGTLISWRDIDFIGELLKAV